MALTRSGAPAPTSSVSNAQALANRSVQNANRAGSTAMQAASPSVPVEITAADGQHLVVSFDEVRRFICDKATDTECKIFLETCKQYKLNPFTKEAYLIHYDNKNDDTASTIVLGKNCYLQMAERNPNFDGFEAGVIVLTADGQLLNREGSIVYDGDGGETLLGGWARSTARTAPAPAMRKSSSASMTPANPSGTAKGHHDPQGSAGARPS